MGARKVSDNHRQGEVASPRPGARRAVLSRTRWALAGMVAGLLAGVWIGGGTDRYGEDDGFLGGLRGARGSFARGYRYVAATLSECLTSDPDSVHNLGLSRQIENRLWQDKRIAAEAITVKVEERGRLSRRGAYAVARSGSASVSRSPAASGGRMSMASSR